MASKNKENMPDVSDQAAWIWNDCEMRVIIGWG